MGIGLGCFCGVILACFALVYLSRVKDLEHNYVIKNSEQHYLKILKGLLIGLICLLSINAVLNLFKYKSLYFLLGVLVTIWLFIFVCFMGLTLREMRKK